jgi:hypothetical protein
MQSFLFRFFHKSECLKESPSVELEPGLQQFDQSGVFGEEEYVAGRNGVAPHDPEKFDFQREICRKVQDYRLYFVSCNR